MELLGWDPWSWSPLAAGLAEGGATHCSESRQLCEPVTRGTIVQGPWGPRQPHGGQCHQAAAKACTVGPELLHHSKDCSGKVHISFSA